MERSPRQETKRRKQNAENKTPEKNGGVRPADLQEVHGLHVPEGPTVAHHLSGGKTRPFFHVQSRDG